MLCTGVFQKPHRYYFSNIRIGLIISYLKKTGPERWFFQRYMGRVRFEPTERTYYLHCLQRECGKRQRSAYTSHKVEEPRAGFRLPARVHVLPEGTLLPSAHPHILAVGFCLLACFSLRTSPHTSGSNARRWGNCPCISSRLRPAFLCPVEAHWK